MDNFLLLQLSIQTIDSCLNGQTVGCMIIRHVNICEFSLKNLICKMRNIVIMCS